MWILTQDKENYFYCERFELIENCICLYPETSKDNEYISQSFDSNDVAKKVFNELVMKHAKYELGFCFIPDSKGEWNVDLEGLEQANDCA